MGESIDRLVGLAGRVHVEGYTRTSSLGNVSHVDAYWRSPAKMSNSEILDELQSLAASTDPQDANRRQALVSEQRRRAVSGTRMTGTPGRLTRLRDALARSVDDSRAFRNSPDNPRPDLNGPDALQNALDSANANNPRHLPDTSPAGRGRAALDALGPGDPYGNESRIGAIGPDPVNTESRLSPNPDTTRMTGAPSASDVASGRDFYTVQRRENGEWVSLDGKVPRFGSGEAAARFQRNSLVQDRPTRVARVRTNLLGRQRVDPLPETSYATDFIRDRTLPDPNTTRMLGTPSTSRPDADATVEKYFSPAALRASQMHGTAPGYGSDGEYEAVQKVADALGISWTKAQKVVEKHAALLSRQQASLRNWFGG